MLSGELILDGMAYGVEERELPSAADPTKPVTIKEVVCAPVIQTPAGPQPGPVTVRIRFSLEQYDEFIRRLQAGRITIGKPGDLNGNGNGLPHDGRVFRVDL